MNATSYFKTDCITYLEYEISDIKAIHVFPCAIVGREFEILNMKLDY